MALKVVTLENLQYYTGKIDAELETKVDKITGKGLSTNDYTTAEKEALAQVVQDVAGLTATGGQANVIEEVQVNGVALVPTEKAVNIDLSAYALKADVAAALIWKGGKATYAELPASGNKQGDVWHVDEKSAEYAWNGTEWVELGSIVDLSDYYKKSEADAAVSAAIAGKTDKTYVDEQLALKANAADVYSKTDADAAVAEALEPYAKTADVNTELAKKANQATTYTKTEVDNLLAPKATTEALTSGLAGKADKVHTHAISEVTDLQAALDAKAVKTDVEGALALKADASAVYTKSEVDAEVSALETAVGTKANAADVYAKTETYTKDEVEALVAGGIEAITTNEIDAMFVDA